MNIKNAISSHKHKLLYPLFLIVVLWIIQIVNATIFQQQLGQLGIYPRNVNGLLGILFAPFLHGSYQHLIGNTLMVLILSFIIVINDFKVWLKSLVYGMLIGGLIIWMFGFSGYHIGSSIWIFSLLGTILGIAYFHKHIFYILMSLILIFFYGASLLYGLVPQDGISFIGHLGGLIAGFACAKQIDYNK